MAEMSEAELNELERKAKEGAQGEWIDHGPSGVITVKQGKQEFDVADRVWDDEDRAHIVAFQPSVALRLIAELRDLRTKVTDLTEVLCDVTNQACATGDGETLHSMALSANAVAMRTLAEMGKLERTKEHGKMVEGKWKE